MNRLTEEMAFVERAKAAGIKPIEVPANSLERFFLDEILKDETEKKECEEYFRYMFSGAELR